MIKFFLSDLEVTDTLLGTTTQAFCFSLSFLLGVNSCGKEFVLRESKFLTLKVGPVFEGLHCRKSQNLFSFLKNDGKTSRFNVRGATLVWVSCICVALFQNVCFVKIMYEDEMGTPSFLPLWKRKPFLWPCLLYEE